MKYNMKIIADTNGGICVESDDINGKLRLLPANVSKTLKLAVYLARKYKADNQMASELSGAEYKIDLVLNMTTDTLDRETIDKLKLASKTDGFDVRFAAYGKDLLLNGSKLLTDV